MFVFLVFGFLLSFFTGCYAKDTNYVFGIAGYPVNISTPGTHWIQNWQPVQSKLLADLRVVKTVIWHKTIHFLSDEGAEFNISLVTMGDVGIYGCGSLPRRVRGCIFNFEKNPTSLGGKNITCRVMSDMTSNRTTLTSTSTSTAISIPIEPFAAAALLIVLVSTMFYIDYCLRKWCDFFAFENLIPEMGDVNEESKPEIC